MLALDTLEHTRETLLAALSPAQPPELRVTAVRVLANFPDAEIPTLLLEGWSTHTPAVRAEIVETLLARPERIRVLLDAIEKKEIDPGQVSPTRQGLLMRNANKEIQEKAKALFGSTLPGPRSDVLKQYATALELRPDVKNGQVVFEKVCATCHKLAGKGFDVGPNLETVRHHPPNQLLANILDPNREVSPNFVEYIVQTTAGKTTSGQILAETATSITLRRANDVQETLLRQDIETLTSSGKSLMPEALEKTITPQEMADLLGYLTARPKR
jgi:putative heme-binding domain-containing protein